jgi:hypothetical protein
VDAQAHQSELPADADSPRAKLQPPFVIDVREVFQLETGAAIRVG